MTTRTPLLEMIGIEKSFPGVRAIRRGRLDLFAGEVLALLGENGAGKSTLIKVLGGAHRPDAGIIRVDGKPVRIAYWVVKYAVVYALAHVFLIGLAALFEPSLSWKVTGTLAAVAAVVIGRWLWRDKPARNPTS